MQSSLLSLEVYTCTVVGLPLLMKHDIHVKQIYHACVITLLFLMELSSGVGYARKWWWVTIRLTLEAVRIFLHEKINPVPLIENRMKELIELIMSLWRSLPVRPHTNIISV